jgi:hypothetical protein
VVVIVAFALSPSGSSDQPSASSTAVVSVAAATPSAAAIEPCAQVLSQLPVQLDGSDPRRVEPSPDSGAPVVAWGNPAIILQCGGTRPKALTEGSSAFLVNVPNSGGDAVNWLPVTGSNATVFTVVDRSVYIQVTVPKNYSQPPLATLSTAIATALPAVCHVASDGPAPTASGNTGADTDIGPLCVDRP